MHEFMKCERCHQSVGFNSVGNAVSEHNPLTRLCGVCLYPLDQDSEITASQPSHSSTIMINESGCFSEA